MALKNRFELDAPDTLFLKDAEQKNVPMDGMSIFIEQAWSMIRNQKELNLPDQREMVANYRCNELKEEALDLIKQPLHDLMQKSEVAVIEGFSELCKGVMKTSVEHYTSVAH